jgi:GNAT superfamily N-acetyltransferase
MNSSTLIPPKTSAASSKLSFQPESVDSWAKDAQPLYWKHWQELGLDLDLKIDPNIAAMRNLEAAGVWKILTVRDGKKLVGYVLAIFTPHLHYHTSPPMFIVDAYYVMPEYRSGTGTKLLKYAESVAKTLGAIKIYLTCKVHQDHSKLFTALGYRLSDYAFIKRI